MNFLYAVIIGAIIGGAGGYLLRDKLANAIWLAPVLSIVGALIASALAFAFGDPGYGWKEPILQVVLALAGVGVVAYLGTRAGGGQPTDGADTAA